MTAKEKEILKSLGWYIDELDGERDRWVCRYYMIIKLGIRVEHNHKLRLWDTTQRIIDSLTDSEVSEVLASRKKRNELAATILLSQ